MTGSRRVARRRGAKPRASTTSATRASPATRQRAASHRLAPHVLPHEYHVHVEVDPGRGSTFRGEVDVRLRLGRSCRRVELHAADLRVARARFQTAGSVRRGRIEERPERETICVHFDPPLPAGEGTLRLAFSGRLRHDLRGLYGASAEGRRYAFTQLEAADARRFFPCFDEPAMKARFRLAVTTGAGNQVISNAPIARTERRDDGRRTVHFEATPPLSTYLVALAVGALEATEPTALGPTPIRVWHPPGKGHLTGFALEAARECLQRLEEYFDLAYPYAKLDLVAVPDFEAGAMENAGAVFFRETLLLVDPATVTLTERKRVAEVICHELAHMWYGDLVTMAWWDDLWLNEAFATWMAFHVVDRWQPGWKMWHDFQHHRAAALRLDGLRHTHPIHSEVRSPAEATQNFDLITYEKGASVVRMIERYLGPETFRSGVRTYIRRHREGNATGSDLWRALSEAAAEPVEPIVRGWIEQAGLPLVALRRRGRDGALRVELRQERFRADARPGASRQGGPARSPRWPIPWVGQIGDARGGTRVARHLLRRARETVELGAEPIAFLYGNADEGGFFRPLHDASELECLGRHRQRLTAVERMGLVDHQWTLARAGRAPLQGFLELVEHLADEPDPDVLLALRGPLGFLEDRLAGAAGAGAPDRLRAWLVRLYRGPLAALGWDPAEDEPNDPRLRRAALLGILGEVAAWPPVLEQAAQRFRAFLADRRSLDPNLADVVVTLAARTGDAARFAALLDALGDAATPQERRRFLLALGDFRPPEQVDRALALTLSRRVPTQDVAFLLARLLRNPAGRERSWGFVKRRWSTLRRRMPPMLVTRLVEATPALGAPRWRRDVAAFFRTHPLPTGTRALRQALERFDLDNAFVRREAAGLGRWLAAREPHVQ